MQTADTLYFESLTDVMAFPFISTELKIELLREKFLMVIDGKEQKKLLLYVEGLTRTEIAALTVDAIVNTINS